MCEKGKERVEILGWGMITVLGKEERVPFGEMTVGEALELHREGFAVVADGDREEVVIKEDE